MSCTIYMVSYNFTIHATCSLTLTTYKYNELQMSSAIQKLKANCKTPFFRNACNGWVLTCIKWVPTYHQSFNTCASRTFSLCNKNQIELNS
jgi:hypothetical protein